jgi:hypothetical protein
MTKVATAARFDAQQACWMIDGRVVRIKFDHGGGDTALDLA